MITTIPFAGFYESMHSQEIHNEIEQIVADDSGCNSLSDRLSNEIWDDIDWAATMENYAKSYAAYFECWFGGYYGIALKYESMSSPREYNFTTDRIFVTISKRDARKLLAAVQPKMLTEAAKQRFTSYDGFISSYSSDVQSWGDITQWDHNQLGTLIVAAIAQLDDADWEYDIFERMSGNGAAAEALTLTDKGDRIAKIAHYLRKRQNRVQAKTGA